MINILTDFFNLLPDLVIAIGPISVYAGMGTGSQSGRMQFKQIYGDETLDINDGATGITFSAPSYLSKERIILDNFNIGSYNGDYSGAKQNIIIQLTKLIDFFGNSDYYGAYLELITSHNTASERKTIKWITLDLRTSSLDDLINTGQILDSVINYFENIISYTGKIRFDVELFLELDKFDDQPRDIKLSNPLFNSFNPNKVSSSIRHSQPQITVSQFINRLSKNKQSIGLGPDGYSQAFYSDWAIYNASNFSGSSTILGRIYQISKDPKFYGDLSYQVNACFVPGGLTSSMGDYNEYTVGSSVYVEPMQNLHSKFSVPPIVHSFRALNTLCGHNFYADSFYDNEGLDAYTYSSAGTTFSSSTCLLQLIDTYKIYTQGTTSNVYFTADNNKVLNDLSYNFTNYKYLNSYGIDDGFVPIRKNNTIIQVVPYYSEIYIIALRVESNPDGNSFYDEILNTYFIKSDKSISLTSGYFTNTEFINIISDQTLFENAGRPYIMIHSNDDLMNQLGGVYEFNYGGGNIFITGIYKGHTFRPFIYPLNFQQLLIEMPKNYYSNDYTNLSKLNGLTFSQTGDNIDNKKLRFIIYNKKTKKYRLVNSSLVITYMRSLLDNKISMITAIDSNYQSNLENILLNFENTGLLNVFRKNYKPGSIEVFMCFYDTITHRNSLINDYKLIITKYGRNEVFRIVKGAR